VGVFCDYFRTADTDSVARLMAQTGGESPLTVDNGHIDGVDAEGIDPAVALGKLVALILGLDWEPGLVAEWLAETLKSLAALARRASAGGERLYCWVSM